MHPRRLQFAGGTVLVAFDSRKKPNNITIWHPRAFHKVRWMGKLIYCFKIDLLAYKITSKLPEGAALNKGQPVEIQRFVCYVIVAVGLHS